MSISYANSLNEVGAVAKSAQVASENVPAAAAFSEEVEPNEGNWERDDTYEQYLYVDSEGNEVPEYHDDKISTVDEEKNIVLGHGQLSLEQEENSQYVQFEMPLKYDGFDLSKTAITIHYDTSAGKHYSHPAVDVMYNRELGLIRYSWLIEGDATQVPGKLILSIHADGVNSKGKAYRWKTKPYDKIVVHEALCTDCDGDIEIDDSWVQKIVDKVGEQIAEANLDTFVTEARNAAEEAAESAINSANAATSAVNEALEKGKYTQEEDSILVFENPDGDTGYVNREELEKTLSDYYTEEETNAYIEGKLGFGEADKSKTVAQFVEDKGYLTEHQSLDNYPTKGELEQAIKEVDVTKQLQDYALKTEIPTNVSAFTNDAGYLTTHQSLDGYATEDFVTDKLGDMVVVSETTDEETGEITTTETPVTVKEYVDTAVANINISDRLGDIKDGESNDITVEAYVAQEIGKVDVSAQINAKVGEIGEDTVKEYVDNKVGSVNVSEQLKPYATTEAVKAMFDEKLGKIVIVSEGVDEETEEPIEIETPVTVKEYVDTAVQSVDVKSQLVGLAKEEYVEERLGELGETVIPGEGEGAENTVVKKTVKQYVDEKVNKIDLSGYATTAALEDVNDNTTTNAENIALVRDEVSSIQDTLNALEGDNKNLIVKYDEVGSLLHLYEKNDNGDIVIDDNGEQIKVKELYATTITGAGGGGTALVSTVKLGLRPEGSASSTILFGTDTSLNYALSTRKARETQDDSGNDVTVYEEAIIAGDITLTLYRDNVYMTHFTVTKDSAEIQTGSVNVSDYVKLGKQVFTITASYNEKLGADGESITVRSSAEWSVNSVKLELTGLPDDVWEATPKYGSATFSYTPVGALEKNIYFKIDNSEPEVKIDKLNGHTYTYTIPQLSHGVHNLTVWCEGNIDGITIPTEPRKYVLMFVEEGNNEPIIRIKAPEKLEQYSSDYIYYNIFDPANDIIKSASITDEEGTVLSSVENITSAEQKWEFKPLVAKDKTITIAYNEIEASVQIQVTAFPYEINPVTNGLVVDFSPVGRSNSDSDYNMFKNGVDTEIDVTWTFSDNFDWINGGWKTDENEDAYFCVKAGTFVDIGYNLFGSDGVVAKQDANGDFTVAGTGKEFKLVFKTTNVAKADTTWLKCIDTADKKALGIRMEAQNAYIDSSIGTLEIPYVDDDVIEFDMNIIPITKFTDNGQPDFSVKAIPMIITYEDGTPVQPKVISSASINLKQDSPKPITIGSDYCDVCIYRMKIYDRYLEDKEIISNFIADARTGTEMAKRYLRNDIYPVEDKQKITPESVAAACPDLKVYVLSAPYFTNDKGNKVESTTIRQIHNTGTKEKPEYDASENWTAVGATHNGQGTSSNEYGYSGRNLEFNMKKATITLNDNVTVVKNIQLSPTSYPTNYLNFKANIASSEHANNALLQKRYDRYLPYTTIASLLDERKKGSMEFFNCVVFIQETNEDIGTHREFGDTDIHFYSIGNIGDSKKTDSTRVNDPADVNEFCVEIMDWNRYLSSFPENTKLPTRYMDGNKEVSRFEEFLIDKNLGADGILYEKDGQGNYVHSMDESIDMSKTYYVDILEADDFSEDYTYGFRYVQTEYDKKEFDNYKELNAEFQKPLKEKWIEFYRFVTRDLTTNGVEDADKVEAWKRELSNWFVLDAIFYYYLYTLRYTMVDNRAKNTFWHWGKHYITLAEALEKGITVYDADKKQITDTSTTTTRFYDINGNEITNINATAAAINDGYRMDFWDYDNDTALGIDNAGKLEIPFGVEDEDTDAAGVPYFRAHDSVVFSRIAKYCVDELENMWHATENNPVGKVFDSHSFINEFDSWQEQFPEELWRIDYERKYKRTYVAGVGPEWDNALPQNNNSDITSDRFLTEMMNGRKKYQRRCFERNQEIYMSSKFLGEVNFDDEITLRGVGVVPAEGKVVEPSNRIYITPFSKMYVNLYNATDAIYYHKKCEAGVLCEGYDAEGKPNGIPYPSTDLDFIHIRGASQLQSIGDLSAMYLQTAEMTAGAKLKEIVLGNKTDGYTNNSLKTLGVGKGNKLLEELDIRNLSNLTDTVLPVKDIPSLKKVYAQGSNITEASFANSGLLEEAYLPASITRLELRNLHYLKSVSLESYENLLHLVVVNCSEEMNEVVLDMINQASDLKTLRVTNIDWTLDSTDVLERLYNLITDSNSPEVVLSGKVYVSTIRQHQFKKFKEQWPDLTVTYPDGGWIEQYTVSFTYCVGNEIKKEHQSVDKGSVAIDPTTVAEDPITPTKTPTISHEYSFSKWVYQGTENEFDFTTPIYKDVELEAEYSAELRTYTINYYSYGANGQFESKYKAEGKYGTYIPYPYEDPTYTGLEAEGNTFYLFKNWKGSGFIDGENLDENGEQRIDADFDVYEYNSDSFRENGEWKPLANMTPDEIYALIRMNELQPNLGLLSENSETSVLASHDTISITMGNDTDRYDMSGCSELLISNGVYVRGEEGDAHYGQSTYFDGTGSSYIDTGITLFDEDKDFVLAMDYEFLEGNSSEVTLSQCYRANASSGFKIVCDPTYSAFTGARFKWCSSDTNNMTAIGNREMVVLRHVKGEKGITLYKSALDSTSVLVETLGTNDADAEITFHNYPLLFGCGQTQLSSYNSFAKANINWSKIWYKDLGDDMCKKLAEWIHEDINFEVVDLKQRYYLSDDDTGADKMSTFTLAATSLLDRARLWNITNDNEGGWEASLLNTMLNGRFYNAIPHQIRSLIKKVKMPSSSGNKSTTIVYPDCYIAIPSVYEVDATKNKSPYNAETNGGTFATMTLQADRIKYYPDGTVGSYWLRSPSVDSSTATYYVWYVKSDGGLNTYGTSPASENRGVLVIFSL